MRVELTCSVESGHDCIEHTATAQIGAEHLPSGEGRISSIALLAAFTMCLFSIDAMFDPTVYR